MRITFEKEDLELLLWSFFRAGQLGEDFNEIYKNIKFDEENAVEEKDSPEKQGI